MTRVTNTRSNGAVGVGGKLIEPQQSADLDLSAEQLEELRSHPFVKEGWLRIESSGGDSAPAEPENEAPAQPAKNARDLVAEIAEETDEERLYALVEDSRKSVSEAAAKRLEELEEAESGFEEE